MRTRWHIAILLAALPALAHAETSRASFTVGATVVPRLSIAVVAAPTQVQVTPADLARGYLDVAATYRVETSDLRGYLLSFATRNGLTGAVEVNGLGAPVVVDAVGTETMQTRAAPSREYALTFRLHLLPTVRIGAYDLPVVVGVRPL
jgi:hypothetical protein